MDGTNHADIPIFGTYTFASACHIEGSWAGGAYSRIATLGSGTSAPFSGTLTGCAAGPRATLSVRIEEDHSVVTTVSMAVGIILLYVGDSTVDGYWTNSYSYVNTSVGICKKQSDLNNDVWEDANTVSEHCAILGIADLLAAQLNIAIGYYVIGAAGTDLVGNGNWDDDGNVDSTGTTATHLYDIEHRFLANSRAGRIHAIFADFGTNNALTFHANLASYASYCVTFANYFATQITGAPPVFYHLGAAGNDNFWDDTRGGVLSAVATGPLKVGSNLIDLQYTSPGEDGAHPITDAHRLVAIQRHYLAAKGFFAGTGDVRGPRVSSITRSGANVDIVFDQTLGNTVSASLTATAFSVTDGGSPATVSSATVLNATTVRLVLSAVPSGTVLVSFGRTNLAANGATIPLGSVQTLPDATTAQQLAEPFYDITAPIGTSSASGVSRSRLQLCM
jgi:hypothetical protein